MILSSTSPYALLKEFSIACGFKYDAVFRVCLNNFCERLWLSMQSKQKLFCSHQKGYRKNTTCMR